MPKLDFSKTKNYPLSSRKNKVSIKDFVNLKKFPKNISFENIFPHILKGIEIKEIVQNILAAVKKKKPIIFGMGSHVIKCGLSPLIIDLMKRGIVTAIALNGSGAIHDYEIAYVGGTSEDVAEEIKTGRFGMVDDTGRLLNAALKNMGQEQGLGEIWGKDISRKKYPYKKYSILANAYELSIPVSIHVAIGTDIIHLHPSFDAGLIGKGSYNDFKLFAAQVAKLGNGGGYFNIGSSVILPEVFLKALTLTRNIGVKVENFFTVNMDMLQHYRPLTNVVKRPNQDQGKGYSLTGHHEIMLPLLYSLIIGKGQ